LNSRKQRKRKQRKDKFKMAKKEAKKGNTEEETELKTRASIARGKTLEKRI